MKIREIAKSLGVAPSTVSIVLNGKKGVGKELREKITAVLVENGYQIRNHDMEPEQNMIAFLYYRNTKYVEDYHDDTFGAIIDGVQQVAGLENCRCTVVKTNEKKLAKDIEEINKDPRIKGAIFAATEFIGKTPGRLLECHKPLVVVDSSMDAYPINTVDMNNSEGMRYIFEYLKKKGYEKIGYIRSTLDNGCLATRQMQAYCQAKLAGIEIVPEISGSVSQLASRIGEDMEQYISGLPYLPAVILTDNDFIALNLIKTLWKHNLHVPDDISVIGFDDSVLCQYTVPRLTTVRVNFKKIGVTGAKRLFEMLKTGDSDVFKTYVNLDFVEGDSVAATS